MRHVPPAGSTNAIFAGCARRPPVEEPNLDIIIRNSLLGDTESGGKFPYICRASYSLAGWVLPFGFPVRRAGVQAERRRVRAF